MKTILKISKSKAIQEKIQKRGMETKYQNIIIRISLLKIRKNKKDKVSKSVSD